MNILSIMDPLDQLSLPQDTTIGFLNAAAAKGHTLYICNSKNLSLKDNQTWAWVQQISIPKKDVIEIIGESERALCDFECVWMRKDPPVDQTYLHNTYLLDFAHTWVINPPDQLRAANEKLYALHFPEYIPETRLSSQPQQVLEWLEQTEKSLIVKPLDGFAGLGVFLLNRTDKNARSILELLTDHGRRWIVVQEYLSAARVGDKRVILLEGQIIGAILRTPQDNDHRGNIHVGGTVSSTELTYQERVVCEVVGERLKSDGIFFAGIDLIDGQLTEVNLTSPTGIRELELFYGIDVGQLFIEAIERHISTTQKHISTT